MQRTIRRVLALACAALLLPAAAAAKGPPCPPGDPVEASATFKQWANAASSADPHTQFIARITVRQAGEPLPGQVPSIGLTRHRTEHPGGYLYFPRDPTNADGVGWVPVTVPNGGRWSYNLYACPDERVQQSGPIPADGSAPTPRTSLPADSAPTDSGAPPAGDHGAAASSDDPGISWGVWAAVGAAIAAAAAVIVTVARRERARA